MNTRVGTGVVILAAAVLATLGACSGEAGEDGSGPKPTTTPQARRENIVDLRGDPAVPDPLKFDPRAAHVLPTGVMKFPPIALHGRAAWLSHAAGLTVYDLGTGKVVSDIETENTPTYDVPAPAKLSKKQAEKLGNRVPVPEPVQINGVPAVVTVVPVKLAAKDGGEEHAGFEVIAARADNGKLIWRLPVDVYGDPAGELGALQMSSSGDTVAVAWTVNGSLTGTFAFTLDKPRMVWQRSDFLLIGGYGEALIGFRIEAGQDYSLAGAAIADGRDLWHKRVPDGTTWAIREGGGPLVKLDDDTDQAQLIEIATGDVAVPKKAGLVKAMACDRGEGAP
ncbi:hypothetical protein [Thermocatellispora tengchongensis]|uniref:hypothetical protein n=1 Tax=Thermocatellispora tengchongensis TaxID=1073253 RepID=UPI0036420C44